MFKIINDENIFNLNFEEKEFFISQIEHIKNLLRDSLKIIYEEEGKVKAFFLITIPNEETYHIAFYVISPKMEDFKIIDLVGKFLDFLEKVAKENKIKYIFGGVDYFNDDLFEKFVEKGFSVISYRMRKEIK